MNALVPVEQPQVPTFSFGDISRIADAFAKSRMFGVSDPAQALTLCLLAQAEGQHPAAAFRDYSIIQGKPAKKAEAMLRDFLTSGGKVKWITLTDECAEATFSHPAGGEATINWTLARASKAGMGGKDMWKKYPRQMLRARVVSEGVRTVCPMATSGLYVPEEAQDFAPDPTPTHDAATGELIEANVTDPNDPLREPAPREKLEGLHSSKTALRNDIISGVNAVRACQSLDELDGLMEAGTEAIAQAERYWPILLRGDPRIPEDIGLYGEVEKRRAELAPHTTIVDRMGELVNQPEDDGQFAMLVASMKETQTLQALTNWMAANEPIIEQLDGAESRKFELAFNLHESAILEVAKATAG